MLKSCSTAWQAVHEAWSVKLVDEVPEEQVVIQISPVILQSLRNSTHSKDMQVFDDLHDEVQVLTIDVQIHDEVIDQI